MTTEPQEGRLDDGLTVLRRVRDCEVLEEDGNLRPIQPSLHSRRPGRKRLRLPRLRDHPGANHPGLPRHLCRGDRDSHHQRTGPGSREGTHRRRPRTLQHHWPQDQNPHKSNCTKLPMDRRVRSTIVAEYLRAKERNCSDEYRQELRRRQTISEGTFASLDRLGWARTRLRGLWKVDCEGYVAALAHNVKKLVRRLAAVSALLTQRCPQPSRLSGLRR